MRLLFFINDSTTNSCRTLQMINTIFNDEQRGKTIPILEFVDPVHHRKTNRKKNSQISFVKCNGNSFEIIEKFNESIKTMFKWKIICWTLLCAGLKGAILLRYKKLSEQY